jgi:hypothetical protein
MITANLSSPRRPISRPTALPASSTRSQGQRQVATPPAGDHKMLAVMRLQPAIRPGTQRPGHLAEVLPAGHQFARQRLGRTVELVGSCIMLLGFLVLALFA